MGRFLRSDEAKADLIKIGIDLRTRSPIAAARFKSTFREACRVLSEFPLIGRSREELAPSIRSFANHPYIIFYQPLDDGIMIIRVIHSSRDLGTIFGV